MSTAAPPTNTLPVDPPAPVVHERPDRATELRAWGQEMDWLDAQYGTGALIPYADEYVITAEHVILSHGRDLSAAYKEAERKADERGIPRWKLVNYFCCCS